MGFVVKIKINYTEHDVHVKPLGSDGLFEQFQVTTMGKSCVMRSNRPMLRSKGLMKKRPAWSKISGEISYQSDEQKIIDALMVYLDRSK